MDEKWWKRKRKVGERSDKEAVKERRRNATETEKKRLKFKRNEKETLRAFALTLNICTHTFRNQAEQTYIYICIPRHIPHGPGPSRNMPYHTMPHHAMPHHDAHTTPHHTIPYHTTPYHMRRYLKKKAQFPTARQNA
jgi:hypothetical protein